MALQTDAFKFLPCTQGLDGDVKTIKGRWQNVMVRCSCCPHTRSPVRAVMQLLQWLRFKPFCNTCLLCLFEAYSKNISKLCTTWITLSKQNLIQLTSKACKHYQALSEIALIPQELVECSQSMHFFICSKSVVFPEVKFCVLNVALRLWTSLTKAIRQSKPGRRIVLSKPTLEKIGSMNQNTITF